MKEQKIENTNKLNSLKNSQKQKEEPKAKENKKQMTDDDEEDYETVSED